MNETIENNGEKGAGMRITEEIANINYNETKQFFKKRAERFKEDNPYSVTMYQDDNQELVRERNQKEVDKLLPLLKLQKESRVLDVGCGIGRWADALPEYIEAYCGVDFSGELIEIANKRNKKENFFFYEGATNEIERVLKDKEKGTYNTVLIIGNLVYLNDEDIDISLRQIERICEPHAIICIREPIGIEDRLTLKDFYSEELEDNYNAIYRTRTELMNFFEGSFLEKGFQIQREGFLFDEDKLNNRKETAQYYYILER